jgi:hypothetical protein
MAQIVCPLVSAEDRVRLEAIVADRTRAQKHGARARIIIGSAKRLTVAEVARHAKVGRPAVWRWQERRPKAGSAFQLVNDGKERAAHMIGRAVVA